MPWRGQDSGIIHFNAWEGKMRDPNSNYDTGCHIAEMSAKKIFSTYGEGDTIPYAVCEEMDDLANSELTRLYGQIDLVLVDDGGGYVVTTQA